jgi:hypothetical protein
MAIAPQNNQLRIPTPQGHEIVASVRDGQVLEPKVVNKYTGVMLPLDDEVARALANSMQAGDIGKRTQLEVESIRQTLDGFGKLALALGNDNPAIKPHYEQLEITGTIAQQMQLQEESFATQAGCIADQVIRATE